jgi:hypothetical protein
LPPSLRELQRVLRRGLRKTEMLWPPVRRAFAWVHRAVHILNNHDHLPAYAVQTQYQVVLEEMREHQAEAGQLTTAIDQFLKITASFAPGLFQCYDVPHLPRTNNDLEHTFGIIRHHERRATGRPGTVPGLVVRGAVRVVAAIATRLHTFTPDELCPLDHQAWWLLRRQVAYREESRRRQFRFRKDPVAYLADIEARLIE